ncbi:hypothetical protein [Nitrincola tapanii]|uniref:Uncharacterized protein n=1 Tax=Nitrincola tapanii TaxID=1708751 RepID=A0A5A9W7M3_9GAMM|nr:hypothetical protein [Nitrincola tapanii]KAA0876464.1 hypothetical protein E1H14_01695 [Nitrincola tapanii]
MLKRQTKKCTATFILLAFLVFFPLVAVSSSVTGVVVLEDTPGCDHFVVETSGGYSLLEWYGGVVTIWEGDKVFGEIHSYGFKDIYIDGRGEMRVWVEDYWVSDRDALEYFHSNCR